MDSHIPRAHRRCRYAAGLALRGVRRWCLVRNRHSVTRTLHGCWSGWWCLHESCRRRARLALLRVRLTPEGSSFGSSRHRSLGSPAQRATGQDLVPVGNRCGRLHRSPALHGQGDGRAEATTHETQLIYIEAINGFPEPSGHTKTTGRSSRR